MEITVNGEPIPRNLFEQERDRLHMDPDSPPYEELEELLRDPLIARTLIFAQPPSQATNPSLRKTSRPRSPT